MIRRFLSLLSLAFAVLAPQLGLSQERLTLGLTTRAGSTSLPFVIAEEKGLFKSEGLNAVVIIMQNQVVVNGVVTRNVDYGGTFSNFVGAAISGLPVRIVMSAMDGSDHYLVTSANVKRVEDLKGKTFGISSFGGTPHSEAVMILRKHGMNPDKDVTFSPDRRQLEPLCGARKRLDSGRHAGAAVQQLRAEAGIQSTVVVQ
jgi:NitT/TauT family transport system substrate-binding protein